MRKQDLVEYLQERLSIEQHRLRGMENNNFKFEQSDFSYVNGQIDLLEYLLDIEDIKLSAVRKYV